jgi:hypothetical protein
MQSGHEEAHILVAKRLMIWMYRCPTIWVVGDPCSEDELPPFPRETSHHPYYKYLQTYRYTLAAFSLNYTEYPLELSTDLGIGAGLSASPNTVVCYFVE